MPRPKAQAPAISRHLSGQAITKVDGVTFYLGKHNSAESFARYAVLLRRYQENGFKLPDDITPESLRSLDVEPGRVVDKVDESQEPITVKHIVESYRGHVKVRYAFSQSEKNRLLQVCTIVENEAGKLEADKFGPRLLLKMRGDWIKSGKTRQYCNRLANAVIRMFKWAVSQELVDISTHQRLKTVEPLRIGETDAPETKPILPANLDHVRATAIHLPPQLKAVIRIMVVTGARPSEILTMKPAEIDRSGDEWFYRPKQHKNAKRGKTRSIPLVGDAKEAVIDYLNRDADAYCFSPKEAVEWWNAQKRAARKSKVQPSQQNRRNPNATKLPTDCYDKHSLGRAISRACKKANVPAWHPYQLRHLAGTMVRDALGCEAAQALLGHSSMQMTQHYAKINEQKAAKAAKSMPKL
ncbi:MAG: tyrosine-type recombinase/integrase [Pirellula sp.]|jgi:integrase|nr:tyrosine-type recombinase/integrase [Pirellula sp.]